jgi:glycosyltransferase involved in cell wall biosynthesis
MTNRPTVSVVIPTRDRWPLLERAVRVALAQEVALEVIVVDDASRERAPDLPALADPRVSVHRQPSRQGVANARNAGIELARAPWIAFLDDDDLWAPTKLPRLLATADSSGAEFAYSSALVIDESRRPLALSRAPSAEALRVELLTRNAVPGGGSNLIASAQLLNRYGGFDSAYSFTADWELWIRFAEAARGAAVDEVLMAYVHHTGSWILGDDPAVRSDLEMLARERGVSLRRSSADHMRGQALWWSGRRWAAAKSYLAAGVRTADPGAIARAGRSLLPLDAARALHLAAPVPDAPDWLSRAGDPPSGAPSPAQSG